MCWLHTQMLLLDAATAVVGFAVNWLFQSTLLIAGGLAVGWLLRRRDCFWNLLRRLAEALFFYQPLLWLLSRRLEATAEEVCDDYVVQLGGDPEEYARRLVDIAELSSVPVGRRAARMSR